jgi:hypothetical protein
MRQALGWTAALSLGLVAACGTGAAPGAEETAARTSLQRDLTLGGSAPPVVEVASAVELGRAQPPRNSTPRRRSVPKPAPAPSEAPPRPEATPSPEPVAAPEPVAVAALELPAAAEPAPRNDRELAPGETITLIPASTGTASGGGGDIGLPAERGRGMWKGGAGNCPHPPRGISGRPVGISRLPLRLPRR